MKADKKITVSNKIITLLDTLRLDDIVDNIKSFNSVCVSIDNSRPFSTVFNICDCGNDIKISINSNFFYTSCFILHKGERLTFNLLSERALMKSVKRFTANARKDDIDVYLSESRLCLRNQ